MFAFLFKVQAFKRGNALVNQARRVLCCTFSGVFLHVNIAPGIAILRKSGERPMQYKSTSKSLLIMHHENLYSLSDSVSVLIIGRQI